MKKCVSLVLSAVIMILSLFTLPVFAENSVEINDIVNEQNTADSNRYSSYIKAFKNVAFAERDIKIEIGESLSKSKTFKIDVPEDALYTIGMSYKSTKSKTDNLKISLSVDNKYLYSEMTTLEFPRMWCDEEGVNHTDAAGNEYVAKQVIYDGFFYRSALDLNSEGGDEFYVHLTKGVHTVTISPCGEAFDIEYFMFGATKTTEKYKAPSDNKLYYDGSAVVIEGEDAKIKSSYFLVGKSDSSTVKITPYNAEKNVINYIGGGNWKSVGETLVWDTPVLKEGYYQLGFSFRQNAIIGGKTYRSLKIDGEYPFKEARDIGFSYNDEWQQMFFADESGTPYYIYFSEGSHKISLTVTSGDISLVRTKLTDAVARLGDLYIDITMITGENVDTYRDYALFNQIPNMEDRIKAIISLLSESNTLLNEITGQKSGSHQAVLNNMVETLNQMLNNKFEAHRYKSSYYTNYCSVSSVLQELRSMPLDLDKMVLTSVGSQTVNEKAGFFQQFMFSVKRFFVSFIRDYNNLSNGSDDSIVVWVNWGRDQAQVLTSLIDRQFTPQKNINVEVQLVNASMVQAVLSGDGPDCFLQHSRSEPVNLAMRGALYDLSQFDDCKDVLSRFQNGADTPYRYKDGLYALPDTQTFFMMFYRKDILDEFGLNIPKTWEDFTEVAKVLMRHNMTVWLPNNVATDTAQVNAGVGSNNIFPSLLLQNGLSLYADGGRKTNLMSSEVMEVFGTWTNYYRKLKIPLSLDFYNRFRLGTAPIGVSVYTLYTTLKVAAPEIDGLWGMTSIPGLPNENGKVSHATSGGGTGCGILKATKNPEKAWEFIKWWTDSETQLTYSNDVESILGPSGRIALSNVEAIKGLSWDDGMIDQLLNAWQEVEEIPEYPGSYYVSRSIYQSFWNIVSDNQNAKDMLMQFGKEADEEIARKWKQYAN